MSRFVRRWSNWGGARESGVATADCSPETRIQRTDKTDKSTSVGSVSGLAGLSGLDFEAGAREDDPEFNPEMPTQRTDKTDKTTSVSSVGATPGDLDLAEALHGGVRGAQPSILASEVVAMRLSEFAQARLVVEVRSDLLDEVVIFASDNAAVDPGEQRVVYRANELRELLGLSAKDLRAVHAVKQTFRGTILPS